MCVSVTCSFVESASPAALAVTVTAVFQLPVVNVRLVGFTEMPLPAPVIATVTPPPTGCVARTTV